jgi:DNA/RNA-binding domain of Phe-tRNA-synthetase-like protein
MSGNSGNSKVIRISSEVFNLFPDYRRGLVIANQLTNGKSPENLVNKIRIAEQNLRHELTSVDINTVPRLESWREAFRLSGIKPTKFRPSIDALVRRVISGNDLPSINLLVDIGNLVSLSYLIPVGAHAIDVIDTEMDLRFASGSEEFLPFGSDVLEHPDKGEIIFTDGNQVMTRRWAWRQAEHSLVRMTTTSVEFNIDMLPPLPDHIEDEIFQTVIELVKEYCGGQMKTGLLDRNHPEFPLH